MKSLYKSNLLFCHIIIFFKSNSKILHFRLVIYNIINAENLYFDCKDIISFIIF